jgi:Ca-activated chloride channel family protein
VSFAWPVALLGLLLVPVAVAGYVVLDRRRRREATRFTNPALAPNVVGRAPGWRRHAAPALALAAFALLLVGIARPEWTRDVPREEATVMLALDTSRSMAATDVEPTRLGAARRAASAFLDTVPDEYRVGIVSFSTRAEVVLPPTTDREAARKALAALRLGSGTAIGDAIVRALAVVRPQEGTPVDPVEPVPASIVLLSDGAQTAGGAQPLAAAQRARRQDVPVSTVALGRRDAVVEVPLPGGLKEQVTVPPDAATLRRVAQVTGGSFFAETDPEALRRVYEDLGSRLVREPKREEVTSVFAAMGGVLLLAGGALSSLWFGRAL